MRRVATGMENLMWLENGNHDTMKWVWFVTGPGKVDPHGA